MLKLLIVDDEQLERKALRQIIESQMPVIDVAGEARNGDEAVDLALELKPHIILMDIKMPGKSGLAAAEEIKEMLPNTRLVMLTAFDYFEYAQTALKLGAVDYLLKPIRPRELLEVLEQVVVEIREENDTLEENKRVREQLAQMWPYIQTSFIYDLINGIIFTEEEIKTRAEVFDKKLLPALVMVISLDNLKGNGISELQRQLLKQSLFETIQDVFADNPSVLISPIMNDNFTALIPKNSLAAGVSLQNYALAKGEELLKKVNAASKMSVTIGIGNFYDNLMKVRHSYLEALTAQRCGSFLGSNQVVRCSDLECCAQRNFRGYPHEREIALIDKVCAGDNEGAKKLLRAFWEDICRCKVGEELQKACALELLVVLYRAAVNNGADLQKMAVLNLDYIKELMSSPSSESLEEWLYKVVGEFVQSVQDGRMSTTQAAIQSIKNYINENYYKDITLEEVAKHVHMSSCYFSRIFKKEVGVTFKKYLTLLRLEQAKRLLLRTQKTVVEIAADVGYQDASYFCRVFKQEEGVSPNEYRTQNWEGVC